MKLKSTFLLLFCILTLCNVMARSYTSARVTDFFHFVRTPYLGMEADIQNRTDFFTDHPEWSENLIHLADSLIRKELKVENVHFDMEAVTFREVDQYAVGSMLIPAPVENFNKAPRKHGEIYIAIFSTLAAGNTTSTNGIERVTENLLLRIMVEDSDGKKILKKKVKIPFYLEASNYLYQPNLRDTDFEMIYEEALTAAIKGGKRFKKRPLNYQPLRFYSSFTDSCQYYSIRETDRIAGGLGNYELFDKNDQNKGIAIITGGSIKREFTERFMDLDLTSRLKQKGTYKNSMENQFYDFTAGLAINEHEEHNIAYDQVLVIFKVNENKHGLFVLENPNLLTGHWGAIDMRLEYIEKLGICELFIRNKLAGLAQQGKSVKENRQWRHYQNTYFLNSISNEEQAALLNLLLAYKLAYEVELEAIAEANEE